MGLWAWIFGERRNEPRLDASALAAAFEDISQGVRQEEERIREEKERLRQEAERASIRASEERGQEASRDEGARHSVTCARYSVSGARYSVRRFGDYGPRVDASRIFARVLARMVCEKCGGRASACYKRAGISRQLYSRLISEPQKGVDRQTVMRLAIGLKLDMPEARELLESAGYTFRPSSYEDMTFAWCIEHGAYNIFDVNDLLVQGGCAPLTIN